jgi:osmotically-inducible protein OsmY
MDSRRSDERIREDVGDALESHPEIDASDVELMVEDGVVTLSGIIADARARTLAEKAAAAVSGVRSVVNRLRVSRGRLDDVLSDFGARGTDPGRDER